MLLKLRIKEKLNQFSEGLTLATEAVQNETLLSKYSRGWYLHHAKANFQMHHLKFSEAVHSFEKALQARGSPFAFDLYNIGLCFQKLNSFKSSVQYLKKAVAVSPHSAEALNALGFSYSSLAGHDNARLAATYFKKAIEADPSYYVTYFNYGVLLFGQRQFREAIEMHEKAVELKPDFMSPHYGIFRATYQVDKAAALQLMEELGEQSQSDFLELARLLFQEEEYELAHRYIRRARAKNHEVMEWQGVIEFHLDQFQQSEESFEQSISLGSKKPHVWFNLGYSQEMQQKYQQALASYEAAAKMDEHGPAAQRAKELRERLNEEL